MMLSKVSTIKERDYQKKSVERRIRVQDEDQLEPIRVEIQVEGEEFKTEMIATHNSPLKEVIRDVRGAEIDRKAILIGDKVSSQMFYQTNTGQCYRRLTQKNLVIRKQ